MKQTAMLNRVIFGPALRDQGAYPLRPIRGTQGGQQGTGRTGISGK